MWLFSFNVESLTVAFKNSAWDWLSDIFVIAVCMTKELLRTLLSNFTETNVMTIVGTICEDNFNYVHFEDIY